MPSGSSDYVESAATESDRVLHRSYGHIEVEPRGTGSPATGIGVSFSNIQALLLRLGKVEKPQWAGLRGRQAVHRLAVILAEGVPSRKRRPLQGVQHGVDSHPRWLCYAWSQGNTQADTSTGEAPSMITQLSTLVSDTQPLRPRRHLRTGLVKQGRMARHG